MKSASGWCRCPFTAALFVRSFHTLLVLGVPATLVYKDTSLLHRSVTHSDLYPLGVAYAALLAVSLTFYFMTCFTDPGYIVPDQKQKQSKKLIKPSTNSDDDEEEDKEDVEAGLDEEAESECGRMMPDTKKAGLKYRLCDYCEIEQPMRAKHCEDCHKCVRKFDHHCPWLEACVGERNHRYFWMFLLSTFCLILATTYITWSAFEYRMMWSEWLKKNAVLFVDLFILLLGGLVVGGLLGFHSYLMLKGLTTWEAVSRERITYLKYLDPEYNPFNEGLCRNSAYFLCVCRLRQWEKIYAKKAKGSNGVV